MTKPLQINPLKLSQPMGALLAFLGIKNTMPLMHGAQGCASFSKVFFTRHFNDPIAVQTTAVNDITAIVDGGDYSISEAVKNITKKVKPDLVGLFTTGLTETKGDDIKGAAYLLKDTQKMVYVHTPDFEGGLESGFAKAIEAIIEQLVEPQNNIDERKALLIPNVNMTPIEIEKLKEQISLFGFEPFALPDLSDSLDGHLGLKQGALSSGGISIEEIKKLAECALVISVGNSVEKCAQMMKEKNPSLTHLHFDSLGGLSNSDKFYKALLEFKHIDTPSPSIVRWRKRLQDALLDTHFAIGGANVIVALEPDQILSVVSTITEAGANVKTVISPTKSSALDTLTCKVIIGDFEDVENELEQNDLLISNFHGERLTKKHNKALMLRGFPNYEGLGYQLKNDFLYEGSTYLLFEIANILEHYKH
ncbi:nitrogenase iron-molybdenum cofactor biosynthesis protein NifN [Sulfurospirillum arcachonense]|uniref:nitrogenase iron-molybdenum cofactor biosynthesis protein NifN n=1 Tax=Sulfurospirillum arcachonense TaxID=57666 RepID=UPI000469B53E|nr:nitrogenase iron-molybdenum cofactor biosynthesis protein NifN [Sulfurospirillum arcachonense]